MVRRLPSLNALRVFEAAARLGSFSRAADELSVTQSAVSRQVQQLEQQLGAELFARRGPQIRLTDVGREYHAVVRRGLTEIQRGTSRLFGSRPKPGITLSTVPSLISRWLVPRLAEFEQCQPNLSLRLAGSMRLVDFAVDSDIDAAIRYGKGNFPGLAAELLVEDMNFPVCSPATADRLKRPEDLANVRLLVEHPNDDLWAHWLKAVGIESLSGASERLSDDYNVQLQAAALGHGVALGRGLLTADDLRAGRLVCPFDRTVRSPMQYYFVTPPERMSEAAIATTLEWLKTAAAATVSGLDRFCGTPIPDASSV